MLIKKSVLEENLKESKNASTKTRILKNTVKHTLKFLW